MRIPLYLVVSVFIGFTLVHTPAWGKNSARRLSDYKFIETPQEPPNPAEIGGSTFEAAAVDTVVLAYWQLDNALGRRDAPAPVFSHVPADHGRSREARYLRPAPS